MQNECRENYRRQRKRLGFMWFLAKMILDYVIELHSTILVQLIASTREC